MPEIIVESNGIAIEEFAKALEYWSKANNIKNVKLTPVDGSLGCYIFSGDPEGVIWWILKKINVNIDNIVYQRMCAAIKRAGSVIAEGNFKILQ